MDHKIQLPRKDCGNQYELRVAKDFGPFTAVVAFAGDYLNIKAYRDRLIAQGVDPENIKLIVDAKN